MSLERSQESKLPVDNNLSLPGRVMARIGQAVFSIMPDSGCPTEGLDALAADRATLHAEIEAALAQIDEVTRPPSEK